MEFMHAMWEVKVNTALITIALDPNQSDLMKTFTKNFIGSDKVRTVRLYDQVEIGLKSHSCSRNR